jgi:hypothetical protein
LWADWQEYLIETESPGVFMRWAKPALNHPVPPGWLLASSIHDDPAYEVHPLRLSTRTLPGPAILSGRLAFGSETAQFVTVTAHSVEA